MATNSGMAPDASGPLGSGGHTVTPGECINSIADEFGMFWETIWNDPGNSDLRCNRVNPDLLLPGDRLVIPDKRPGCASGATDKRHRFRRKGVPVELVLRIMKDRWETAAIEYSSDTNGPSSYDDSPVDIGEARPTEPEANQPYVLRIDGQTTTGTTGADGMLTQRIPPRAERGRLVLRPGAENERIIDLALGDMDPVSEPRGAAKRLCNLGFPCELADDMTTGVMAALTCFQESADLEATGILDKPTQDALTSEHGS